MNFKNISLLIAMIIFAAGCSPARIISLPIPDQDENSTVMVHRESSFNAGGVGLVFGADSQDYVMLSNNNYAKINLKSGSYEFFARSNQADEPFILPIKLKPGDNKCLKAYANPSNVGKIILPFLYFMTSTFTLEDVECLPDEEILKYREVSVKYNDV